MFRVNVIAPAESAPGGARFVPAGEPSPYHDIAEVPDHLRAFIVGDEAEPESPRRVQRSLRAEYHLPVEQRRSSRARHQRQVAELEAEAEQQAWAEDSSRCAATERYRRRSRRPECSARRPADGRSRDPRKMARPG